MRIFELDRCHPLVGLAWNGCENPKDQSFGALHGTRVRFGEFCFDTAMVCRHLALTIVLAVLAGVGDSAAAPDAHTLHLWHLDEPGPPFHLRSGLRTANRIGQGSLAAGLKAIGGDFAIGNEARRFDGTHEAGPFPGTIDEVRISDLPRDPTDYAFVPAEFRRPSRRMVTDTPSPEPSFQPTAPAPAGNNVIDGNLHRATYINVPSGTRITLLTMNSALVGRCEASLLLDWTPPELTITLSANGRGFDPAAPESGNGLSNMLKRLEESHGSCIITSEPGAGTTVVMRCPCPTPAPTSSHG